MDNVVEYIIKFRDGYSRPLMKANAGTRRLRTNVRSLNATTATFGRTLRTALGPLSLIFSGGMIIRSVSDLTVKLQEAEVAMGSLYELDREGSKRLVDNLRLHAETVPITTQEYINYAKVLAGVGVTQKNLIPLVDSLGDVAAGVGMQKMPFLLKALRDVIAAEKLYGQETRQFRDNAINIIGELAKEQGIGADVAKHMAERHMFSARQVVKAFVAMTEEGGRFHGMMKALAEESIRGKFDILTGKLQNMAYEFANSSTPQVLSFLDKLIYLVDMARAGKFASSFNAFSQTLKLIGSVASSVVGILQTMFGDSEDSTMAFIQKVFRDVAIGINRAREGVLLAAEDLKYFFGVARNLLNEAFGGSTEDAINNIQKLRKERSDNKQRINNEGWEQRMKIWADWERSVRANVSEVIERDRNYDPTNFADGGGAGAGGAGTKGSGIRGMSASARDINITIDRLQVGENIEFKTVKEGRQMSLAHLRDMLLTVVNDVNYIANPTG